MTTTRIKRGKKGRPEGYRLSEASKRAISEAKKGQRHKDATKHKISKSLKTYFRKKNPLSKELVKSYNKVNDTEATDWLEDNSHDLDGYLDVLTQKSIYNKLKIELSYGDNMEDIFSHSLTPELLLMYKEYIENGGADE